MYAKGRDMSKEKPKPFTIICNNCGSNDVTVTAFEHYDLGIKCHNCGAYLNYGSYNEREYHEED